MKKLFLLTTAFLFIGTAVFCQTGDADFKDALIAMGLNPTIVTVVLSVIGILLTNIAIPEKFASITYLLEAGLHWFNEKTNRLSTKQKARKVLFDQKMKEVIISVKKAVPIILLLFILGSTAIAQSPFKGFFKPVVTNPSVAKMTLRATEVPAVTSPQQVWLFRPYVGVTAIAVDFSEKPALAQSFSSGGLGISYDRYVEVNGKPYTNLSVNALFLMGMQLGETTSTALGGAVTLGLFNNVISFGPAYLDKKFLLLSTLTFHFN
jgi:hypothetical protein